MTIDKIRVDKSLRKVRGLYRYHAKGELSPSSFVTKARAELNALYMQHTRGLIEATASHFIEEVQSFQAQFGLDLDCDEAHLTWVNRGFRGIRASMYIRNKVYKYSSGFVEVFIGPFDEWDRVAVHTIEERRESFFGSLPSFYTKRRRNCWKSIQDFDFPTLLQQIKEEIEKPEPEFDEEDVAF